MAPPTPRQQLFLALLLVAWACQVATAGGSHELHTLTQRADSLRARLAALGAQAHASGLPLSVIELHVELGMALQQLNHLKPDGGKRVPEAVRSYRAALASLPDGPFRAQVQGNLAALLLEAGQAAESIAEVDEALRLNPDPGLMFNRAKALSTLGRVADADEAYRRAALVAYRKDLSAFAKATAAMEGIDDALLEKVEEVASALSLALEVNGAAGAGLKAGAEMEDGPGGHAQGAAMIQRRQAGKAATASAAGVGAGRGEAGWLAHGRDLEAAWLGFALYKAHHARRNTDAAWAALVSANAHMDHLQHYSAEQDAHTFRTLISVFNGAYRPKGAGYPDQTPIFIVGLPRSGSTLVEQMLASHSQAWGAGEDTALAPLTPEVNAALSGPPEKHVTALHRLGRKYVETMRERVPERRSPPPPSPAASPGNSDAGAMHDSLSDIKAEVAAQAGAGEGTQTEEGGAGVAGVAPAAPLPAPSRIVDKMLRNLWLVGYIDLLLPRATIIHILRHPMDAGLSCYAQPFGYSGMPWAWNLRNIALQINLTHQLAAHWDAAYPGRVHTVHYEELVQYPREVAAELLSLVGLPWEEQVLNFHKAQRTVATASMSQVRQPLYNSSVARWRRYEPHLEPLRRALGGTVQQYEDKLAAALERRRKVAEAEAMAAAAAAAAALSAQLGALGDLRQLEQLLQQEGTVARAAANAGQDGAGAGNKEEL